MAALYWCDGKRNLAEVIQNTEMELGPQNNFDWVGYFKFLQRHGYVDFVSSEPLQRFRFLVLVPRTAAPICPLKTAKDGAASVDRIMRKPKTRVGQFPAVIIDMGRRVGYLLFPFLNKMGTANVGRESVSMAVPVQPKVYHIVHVDRLPSIVADGCCGGCDADIARRAPAGTPMGMTGIKQRRLAEWR